MSNPEDAIRRGMRPRQRKRSNWARKFIHEIKDRDPSVKTVGSDFVVEDGHRGRVRKLANVCVPHIRGLFEARDDAARDAAMVSLIGALFDSLRRWFSVPRSADTARENLARFICTWHPPLGKIGSIDFEAKHGIRDAADRWVGELLRLTQAAPKPGQRPKGKPSRPMRNTLLGRIMNSTIPKQFAPLGASMKQLFPTNPAE